MKLNEPALVPDLAPGCMVQELFALKFDNPCKTLFCLLPQTMLFNPVKMNKPALVPDIAPGGIVQEVLHLKLDNVCNTLLCLP